MAGLYIQNEAKKRRICIINLWKVPKRAMWRGRPARKIYPGTPNLSSERNHVLRNPIAKQVKAKLAGRDRLDYEVRPRLAGHSQIESIHQQKRVRSGKPHPLVAVYKGMVVDQRLQQGGRLFAQVAVISGLRPENGGFQSSLIEQSVLAAVFLNLVMVNGRDFGHGQIDALIAHL